ncbi:protein-glutamate O-methyltransferase CheR [Sphingomonas sp. SUN039]|uniref:CheR family methyltransferase n=1 Tax=Sphingomonas sp. SUN039 TaxID=2937787 RepID=UPI0021648CD3|nr:CheR family methyltransferase [Sphingomonas sp. SUN039]UVO53842.1 methyltransferase domain-containing protein [Sphingomonas sp. SUN039]
MTAPETTSAATRILSALLEARTGQILSPARSWRIEASLKPILRELGMPTLDPLVAQLSSGRDPALASRVVEALLNNETSFFRDATAFDQLDRDALELLRLNRTASRRLRIWSAACSTGQEAYSLAMLLRDGGPRWAGWTFDILATDASAAAVARARTGRYSRFEIQRGLPVRTMLRWFREDGEDWVADGLLARDIRFATHDIRQPAPGRFDLILCRNVLMYFVVPLRTQVLDHMADALDPGGVLMLGAGETVIGQTERFASHPDMRGLYVAAHEVSRSPLRVATR